MNAGTLGVEGVNKRSRDIGQSPRLGRHALGQVAHALWEVGNLRRDDQDLGEMLVVAKGLVGMMIRDVHKREDGSRQARGANRAACNGARTRFS
jgi:hypothetical protein